MLALSLSWRSLFLGLLGLAATVSLVGCRQASHRGVETFIFARGSDAERLDPADVDDGESVNTLAQICEGLVRFRSGTFEVEPALAESWSVSDDGLRYTFQLRPNVRFHDGVPLDAAAALWSFRRQMEESHPGRLPGSAFQYWNYLYQDIERVEAVGPMTLEFRLSQPNATILRSLAIFPAYLISPRSREVHGEDFVRHPIGTGPYRFVRWIPNQAITLERNPEYWDAERMPGFARMVFKVVPDNTARLMELRSGRAHGIDGLQPAELQSLAGDLRFRVYRAAGMNLGYLAFSFRSPRMADPEMRQAIAAAINRPLLAEVALDGTGRSAALPLPPGLLGEVQSIDAIPYDPQLAREIVGRRYDLFSRPLTLNVMTAPRPFLPDPVMAASLIRSDLQAVGMRVDLVARDFATHLDILRRGDFEVGITGWIGDNGDTDNFLSVFFGSWAAVPGAATNVSFYENGEMDRLLLAARRETENQARQQLYEQALAIWRRDLPILPLTHGDHIVILREEVTGFELQATGDLRLGAIGWAPDPVRTP
jgi:peptide/nickel transport system substrate-binding protein